MFFYFLHHLIPFSVCWPAVCFGSPFLLYLAIPDCSFIFKSKVLKKMGIGARSVDCIRRTAAYDGHISLGDLRMSLCKGLLVQAARFCQKEVHGRVLASGAAQKMQEEVKGYPSRCTLRRTPFIFSPNLYSSGQEHL